MHINIFAVFGCVKSGCRHSVLCTPSQPNDCCKFFEINFHIHEYVYVGSSSCCVVCSCHYFFFYYFIFFFLFSYFFIVLTRQIRACLEGNLRIHITSSRAWCVRTDVVHRWLCREQQPAETTAKFFSGCIIMTLEVLVLASIRCSFQTTLNS